MTERGTGINTKRATVTTAGTAEQLPNFPIPDGFTLVVKAMHSNTGEIELGDTKAEAEGTDSFRLTADKAVTLDIQNADQVFIDATVNGEGVELLVESG